jgi:hypothetical protein
MSFPNRGYLCRRQNVIQLPTLIMVTANGLTMVVPLAIAFGGVPQMTRKLFSSPLVSTVNTSNSVLSFLQASAAAISMELGFAVVGKTGVSELEVFALADNAEEGLPLPDMDAIQSANALVASMVRFPEIGSMAVVIPAADGALFDNSGLRRRRR